MTPPSIEAEARRLVTERCLIAADIDKTLVEQLKQQDHERKFLLGGDCSRTHSCRTPRCASSLYHRKQYDRTQRSVFFWLIEQLCFAGAMELIGRFHFFCNSGGIYAHIPSDDEALERLARIRAKFLRFT